MGQFTTTLVHGQRSTEQRVFVVRGLKNNLLGLSAITSLHLLSWVEAIESQRNGHCRNWKKYSKLLKDQELWRTLHDQTEG